MSNVTLCCQIGPKIFSRSYIAGTRQYDQLLHETTRTQVDSTH